MRVKTIILAAGQGRRLKPLTENTPKCLIKVGGLPILRRQLESLQKHGIKEISIVVGFMAETVKEYARKNFPELNLKFIYNPEFKTTNTIYSLALAAEKTEPEASVLLLNGDVIFDSRIIENLLKTDSSKTFIAIQLKKCRQEEIKISLKKNGAIAALNKKIPPDKAIGEAIGINKFSPVFWEFLAENLKHLKNLEPKEYFEYAIEKTIGQDEKIFPFDIKELKAVEIDFVEDLQEAEKIISGFRA